MVHKNIWKNMALPVAVILISTSCATKIKMQVDRPPNLNTAGIRSIAIMPFESKSSIKRIAQYATKIATSKIRAMNHFTLVDSSEIENLRKKNQSIENHVDALFTGQITRVSSDRTSQKKSIITKDGDTKYYFTFSTSVEVEFSYTLVRTRDGSIIGPISRKGSTSASSKNGYPSDTALAKAVIDEQLRNLGRDIAPYTITEERKFAADKSDNKALKAEMKNALALVKAKDNKAALEAYLGIYRQYKNVAAAENASILYESFGEIQTASDFMKQVFDETGNPRAQEVLARLNKNISDQKTLASEYNDNRGQTVNIAAFASEEIQKFLPEKVIVWIYNNSSTNISAEAITDYLVDDLIRKGVRVFNWPSTVLTKAVQNYQMTGSVSDDDLTDIANATGINIILAIDITGSNALSRLQVWVLDTEKKTLILLSDDSGNWQL